MHKKTIAELKQGLLRKEFSATELTEHYLNRIKKYDKALNSFITLCEEEALAQAKLADKAIAEEKTEALTGIPIAHKDIFCTTGIKTSCGSRMLDNFMAPYDATFVEKYKTAGTILLGKTNMDEFAMGSSNESSFYGPVKNPWDLKCVPGGSSGGSSAAVAARLVPMASGTDTGGSIRQPAALCGITGIKPTYGRISRYGMIAFASSFDQAGIFTLTAEDAAIMLNVAAGHDAKDSTSVDIPVPDYTKELNQSLKGLKIGLPKEYFIDDLDKTTAAKIQEAIEVYRQLGASIHEISLPNTELGIPVYYIIAPAECSSNLARYDGVRYGYRCENPKDLTDLYIRSRTEGFGEEVKRRILTGTYVLSSGFYDAYYLKAQKIRRLISNDFKAAFEQVDLILSPTTPAPAFEIGSKQDPVSMYLCDIFTVSANLAGIPAISIPAGFVGNLPIGLQLMGNYFSESRLLNAAHRYQCETNWHKKIPAGY